MSHDMPSLLYVWCSWYWYHDRCSWIAWWLLQLEVVQSATMPATSQPSLWMSCHSHGLLIQETYLCFGCLLSGFDLRNRWHHQCNHLNFVWQQLPFCSYQCGKRYRFWEDLYDNLPSVYLCMPHVTILRVLMYIILDSCLLMENMALMPSARGRGTDIWPLFVFLCIFFMSVSFILNQSSQQPWVVIEFTPVL